MNESALQIEWDVTYGVSNQNKGRKSVYTNSASHIQPVGINTHNGHIFSNKESKISRMCRLGTRMCHLGIDYRQPKQYCANVWAEILKLKVSL